MTPLADASAPLTQTAAAELRHELRTPVNHIVGYAEMLLEDLAGSDPASRRTALEDTLGAARDVLTLISTSLPGTATEIRHREVVALYESLREPRQRIVSALRPLLDATDLVDEAFAADVQRILAAAERLVGSPPSELTTPDGASAAQGTPGAADIAPARVLVVDDVEDNRHILRRRLEREGYVVECAESGRLALEMVAESSYDLVLLDVLMPELDGYEVLQQLKDAPATRDIPVIMISALDDVSSVVRCIERGAEDYLPKPFDPVLLRARINACIEKKRLRDAEVEYLRQVNAVIDAASAVEAGNYVSGSLTAVTQRADSLGRLARVFDNMATEVRAREERLRDRVRDLKRDIAAARRTPRRTELSLDFANLSSGERFAERYEILDAVGAGAMGMVYKARDLELGEDIAIKTLRPEMVSDSTVIERFKTEIRLARRISHRNVVRMYDFGEWLGVYFLTMEYVAGITVRELIDTRGQLSVSSTLAIGMQLADSLEVAHEQGVIHRDIKPQNLLLDGEGVLKVMDFGVARLAERTSSLTEAGLIVGTPAYMSPEQLLAEALDARSDLYAAGVVLYECLTSRLPFDARSVVSLIAKVLSEEPFPPATLNTDVPPALSTLILQLLAKRPEERVRDAGELRERLSRVG